jgi:biopolymer transport protein ExbD
VPIKPENITITVDKDGNYYWNGERVSCEELAARTAALAPNAPKPPDICAVNLSIPDGNAEH